MKNCCCGVYNIKNLRLIIIPAKGYNQDKLIDLIFL